MGYYQDRYNQAVAATSSKIKTARRFISENRAALERYRGGMPVALLAGIAEAESGGRMDVSGDSSLGEYGFFQITADFPRKLGIDPNIRKTAEGNIFLACLEYNIEAARLKMRYPSLIVSGSIDQWFMARVVFAIGIGATVNLLKLVQPTTPGKVYDACVRYLDERPNTSVSGYPPGKVWMRVKMVALQFGVGAQAGGSVTYGPPQQIPSLVPYQLDTKVAEALPESAGSSLPLPLLAASAAILYLALR